MRPDQFLDALQDTAVLAADQDHAAAVLALHEPANELNAVHPGHVDIQKDQVNYFASLADLRQSLLAAVAGGDPRVAELRQHLGEELEHERVIIQQDNPRGPRILCLHGYLTHTVQPSCRALAANVSSLSQRPSLSQSPVPARSVLVNHPRSPQSRSQRKDRRAVRRRRRGTKTSAYGQWQRRHAHAAPHTPP